MLTAIKSKLELTSRDNLSLFPLFHLPYFNPTIPEMRNCKRGDLEVTYNQLSCYHEHPIPLPQRHPTLSSATLGFFQRLSVLITVPQYPALSFPPSHISLTFTSQVFLFPFNAIIHRRTRDTQTKDGLASAPQQHSLAPGTTS